jgi:hypothetical protein
MGPGGRSGTSDADIAHFLDHDTGALPRDMATDALGEPVDVVKVLAYETTKSTPTGQTALKASTQPGWFRWWHIPAATLPLAAGATTTLLVMRRRRQQARVSAYMRLVGQGRGWWNQVLSSRAARDLASSFQQGTTSMRRPRQRVPEAAALLRDRSGELLAAAAATVAASAAARRASESAENALEAVTRVVNSGTPRARRMRRVAKQQRNTFTATVNGVRLGLLDTFTQLQADKRFAAARASVMRSASRAGTSLREATRIPPSTPASVVATPRAGRSSAKARPPTRREVKQSAKRSHATFARTRAFTLGMVVTAMVTYLRMWRQRMLEREAQA